MRMIPVDLPPDVYSPVELQIMGRQYYCQRIADDSLSILTDA